MEKSSFFGSIDGDRRYKAEDWAAYFASFIGNGVFPTPSTGLQVVADGQGMEVAVSPGAGWINGYFYRNTTSLTLPLSVADGVLSRMDRVVLRWDRAARSMYCMVKTGTPSEAPAAPQLQRDADGWELCLADVLIPAGAIVQLQSDVTDQRLNTELCGIVHGVVEQVDTQTLALQLQAWMALFRQQTEKNMSDYQTQKQTEIDQFQQTFEGELDQYKETKQEEIDQYQQTFEGELDQYKEDSEREFQAWFQLVKDVLAIDGDIAGNLFTLIDGHKTDYANPHNVTARQTGAATAMAFEAVLLASGWAGESAPYSQVVAVEGILETDAPVVDMALTGNETVDGPTREAWACISRMVAGNGTITAYAWEKPAVNIPITLQCTRSNGQGFGGSLSATAIQASASGAMVTVEDAAALPALSAVAMIEPVQSGEGDPSPQNIRPITGHEGCEMRVAGKNLLPNTATSQTKNGVTFTVNEDGSVTANGTATADAVLTTFSMEINAPDFSGCTLSGCPDGGNSDSFFMRYSNASVTVADFGSGTVIDCPYTGYVAVTVRVKSGYTASNLIFKPMLSLTSSTDPAYEPYQGTTYEATFPQTVYSGSYDFVTGKLTVDRGFIESYAGEELPGAWISSMDVYQAGAVPTTGAQVCYELASPLTYDLTPQQVDMLFGLNNVVSDTGDTKVVYIADTKTYIDSVNNSTKSAMRLKDINTGTVYELKVIDGKLTMTEVE